MSHFLRLRTQIRERQPLVQALRDLHYQFQEGENLQVRGWLGKREPAEIVINTNSDYDIGFRRQAQEYEVVADWWGVEGHTSIRQQQFLQQVQRQYSYNLIRDQAREQNLIIEEEQTLENGDVVIVLSERG
jgi:hypothetical protein